jgi:predicted dehydrogenase
MMRTESLDFVDICTPPAMHFALAQAALRAGLHVLCEKPLTTRLSQAQSLVELALEKRRVLYPCHNYLYAPVIQELTRILESGEIGRPHALSFQVFRTQHARGTPEWQPDWRRIPRYAGGGIAMDHGAHALYLAFRWFKAYPTRVFAHLERSSTEYPDSEDQVHATLRFPDGTLNLELTWLAGVRKVIYAIQAERGAIVVNDDRIEVFRRGEPPSVREFPSDWQDAGHAHWFVPLLLRFHQQVRRGETTSRDLEDAVQSVRVIEAIYRAAEMEKGAQL